ncbi:hypothetical protein DRW03_08450 [Corallococcus sp. H22C18031201]|nr:hypothetical protein DRW03_08450 [Corallococcus sp. H22C18031201]
MGIIAASPLVLAFLLGANEPALLEPVLRTTVGGLSWVFAELLGLVGGALFAAILGAMQPAAALLPPTRRAVGTIVGALAPVALCIVPAVALLLAGPTCATVLGQRHPNSEWGSFSAAASELIIRAREQMPSRLPRLPECPRPVW